MGPLSRVSVQEDFSYLPILVVCASVLRLINQGAYIVAGERSKELHVVPFLIILKFSMSFCTYLYFIMNIDAGFWPHSLIS